MKKEVVLWNLQKLQQKAIPKSIKEFLEIKEGSKILFIQKGDNLIIKNLAMIALRNIQKEFDGEAKRLGLETEDDVVEMIKKYRK